MKTVADDPRFKVYFQNMDHADVKHITAGVSLRQFVAGMLSYHPGWLSLLFRLRTVLVKVLGLVEHDWPDRPPVIDAEAISFAPGGRALFFIVREAREERFWVAETPPDNHLAAYFGVVARKLENGMTRFSVFTTVRYLHWTGPVYFNLIRPFHHLVVARMMRAGAAVSGQALCRPSMNGSGGGLINRFSIGERLLCRTGWYGFMIIGTAGILVKAPIWAVVYLVYCLAAFAFVILPGLCAHCPYPSGYSTCLFLPPALIGRFFPYKGPQMSLPARRFVFPVMAGVILLPQFWLIANLPVFLLFWLFALPTVAAFPTHYCRRCRHVGCPMNRVGG